MAPLAELLEAAEARAAELEAAKGKQKGQLKELEDEIAVKMTEKTIAAQGALKELRKNRESIQKESNSLEAACKLVAKAIRKLNRATELGLADWASVREDCVKLSDFARARLAGAESAEALEQLKRASGGAELVVRDGALHCAGSRDQLERLKQALTALESHYETTVECADATTLRLLESRGELSRISAKHGVEISKDASAVRVVGPTEAAQKAAGIVKMKMEAKADLDCPKSLVGAAKAKCKEVEDETFALVEVLRAGGYGGGGMICIRGDEDCVGEAEEKVRSWLDEKEGATSKLVDLSQDLASWTAELAGQFRGDLKHMENKFVVAAKEPASDGRMELRGNPDAVVEAEKELQMIVDFYRKKHADEEAAKVAKAAPKAKKPPKQEEEDDWGAAPMAEPPPCTW